MDNQKKPNPDTQETGKHQQVPSQQPKPQGSTPGGARNIPHQQQQQKGQPSGLKNDKTPKADDTVKEDKGEMSDEDEDIRQGRD